MPFIIILQIIGFSYIFNKLNSKVIELETSLLTVSTSLQSLNVIVSKNKIEDVKLAEIANNIDPVTFVQKDNIPDITTVDAITESNVHSIVSNLLTNSQMVLPEIGESVVVGDTINGITYVIRAVVDTEASTITIPNNEQLLADLEAAAAYLQLHF